MNCVRTLDLVSEALEGALEGSQRAEFDEHLRACNACRHYVEQLRISVEALKRTPKPETQNPHRAALIREYRKKFR